MGDYFSQASIDSAERQEWDREQEKAEKAELEAKVATADEIIATLEAANASMARTVAIQQAIRALDEKMLGEVKE